MKIIDTCMPYIEVKSIYNYCLSDRKTYYLDFDEERSKLNAVASKLEQDDQLFQKMYKIIQKHDDSLLLSKLQRAGINLYLPNTKMYYHADGPVTTALFYINPKSSLEDGGETQFLINDEMVSVMPKPGRLVIFDGAIRHAATSFLNIPRVTLFFKFWK